MARFFIDRKLCMSQAGLSIGLISIPKQDSREQSSSRLLLASLVCDATWVLWRDLWKSGERRDLLCRWYPSKLAAQKCAYLCLQQVRLIQKGCCSWIWIKLPRNGQVMDSSMNKEPKNSGAWQVIPTAEERISWVSESIKNMKKVDVYPYSLVQDETHNES